MRAWIVAPGKHSGLWDLCASLQCVAVGWLPHVDLLAFGSVDDVRDALRAAIRKPDAAPSVWNFAREMRPGDVVVANNGSRVIVGVGVVVGDYLPPGHADNPVRHTRFPHARRVEWCVRQKVEVPRSVFARDLVALLAPHQWEEIKQAYLQADPRLRAALEGLERPPARAAAPAPPQPAPPSGGPARPGLPRLVQALLDLASRTHNLLLCGPPGTGKTWAARQFARHFTDEDKVAFVTFHPSFAYEEFVEGLRPLTGPDGQLRYEVVDGVFKRLCRSAVADPDHKYLLVVDEINRANVAKVLGELITLLEDDKRLGQDGAVTVTLPCSGQPFGVPGNVYLAGTMNTADRSIALLDLALRRRFAFVELAPDPSVLRPVAGVDLRALLGRLNERVAALLGREHQLGHSYFLVEDAPALHFTWYHRVVPLLGEYFYNDGSRLRAVLGDFVRPREIGADARAALGHLFDPDSPPWEVVRLDGDAFLAALHRLAAGER